MNKRKFVIVIACLLPFFLTACSTGFDFKKIDKQDILNVVEIGWSIAQVVEKIGKPNSVSNSIAKSADKTELKTTYFYDSGSVNFKSGVVESVYIRR